MGVCATIRVCVAGAWLLGASAAPAQMGPSSADPRAAAESRPLGAAPGRGAWTGAESEGAAPAEPVGGFGRTAWALAGVVGLILVAGAVFRVTARHTGGVRGALGAGGRAPAGLMEIIGRYPVGRGTTLVLLRLERRVLLLSQSAGGKLGLGAQFTTLSEITDPEEVGAILVKAQDAEGESTASRFRALLSGFDRGMGPGEAPEGRRAQVGPSGDRAELWEERRDIPVVDLTLGPGGGPIHALKRRLGALRGGGAA